MQRDWINARICSTGFQQRGQTGTEPNTVVDLGIIERLDAKPVARCKCTSRISFPDNEREHAVEALHARRPPFPVCAQDDFGIAVRKKGVTFRFEFAPKGMMIVDAAVEDDAEPARGIEHRLRRAVAEI